ncbi:hypothetical protein EI427_05545 [Flammeovirga pectinis]|uniref:Uncharacterized protein n=1 Tax=Flammeovirga pectinis TaxID=2494373 RepID=A0A3Q9FPC2_9BACT|nr:hypothetical protein [Flammeovirga pectinis]AZQ61715.1 hypothetical protein EI427_05545 [Flammeovirga pectinis]
MNINQKQLLQHIRDNVKAEKIPLIINGTTATLGHMTKEFTDRSGEFIDYFKDRAYAHGMSAEELYDSMPTYSKVMGDEGLTEWLKGKHISHIGSQFNHPELSDEIKNVIFEDGSVNMSRGASDMELNEVLISWFDGLLDAIGIDTDIAYEVSDIMVDIIPFIGIFLLGIMISNYHNGDEIRKEKIISTMKMVFANLSIPILITVVLGLKVAAIYSTVKLILFILEMIGKFAQKYIEDQKELEITLIYINKARTVLPNKVGTIIGTPTKYLMDLSSKGITEGSAFGKKTFQDLKQKIKSKIEEKKLGKVIN